MKLEVPMPAVGLLTYYIPSGRMQSTFLVMGKIIIEND